MTKPARIILLNGVGSVGKSSIAKALQTITTETFLHVSMDAFLDMMPAASFEHADGVTFETVQAGRQALGHHPHRAGRRPGLPRHAPRRRRHGRAGQRYDP